MTILSVDVGTTAMKMGVFKLSMNLHSKVRPCWAKNFFGIMNKSGSRETSFPVAGFQLPVDSSPLIVFQLSTSFPA